MKTSLKKRLDNGDITIEEYEILKKSNVEELLLIKKLEEEKLRNNFKNKLNEIKPYDGISQDILKRVKSTTQLKSQHKKTKPSLKYQQKNNLEKGKVKTRWVKYFVFSLFLSICPVIFLNVKFNLLEILIGSSIFTWVIMEIGKS